MTDDMYDQATRIRDTIHGATITENDRTWWYNVAQEAATAVANLQHRVLYQRDEIARLRKVEGELRALYMYSGQTVLDLTRSLAAFVEFAHPNGTPVEEEDAEALEAGREFLSLMEHQR